MYWRDSVTAFNMVTILTEHKNLTVSASGRLMGLYKDRPLGKIRHHFLSLSLKVGPAVCVSGLVA